jgi:hypothetical protein
VDDNVLYHSLSERIEKRNDEVPSLLIYSAGAVFHKATSGLIACLLSIALQVDGGHGFSAGRHECISA